MIRYAWFPTGQNLMLRIIATSRAIVDRRICSVPSLEPGDRHFPTWPQQDWATYMGVSQHSKVHQQPMELMILHICSH